MLRLIVTLVIASVAAVAARADAPAGTATAKPAAPASPAPIAEPKGATARAALAQYDRAVRDAEAALRRARAAASQQAVAALEAAKREAMTAGNLPEAVAIDAKVKAIRAENDASKAPAAASTGGAPGTSGAAAAALKIDGRWRQQLADGWESEVVIAGDRITQVRTNLTGTFERAGNEIRVTWPGGPSTRFVFDGDTFRSEAWKTGRTPFEGKPDIVGEGKRLP